MKQTVFEQMNGTYTQQGDYLIPCLTLHDEEKVEIGLWGQRHLRHLKQSHNLCKLVNLGLGVYAISIRNRVTEIVNKEIIYA